MATGKFVAYLRVSTRRQGASGLGLDAQRDDCLTYLNGGGWTLVETFVEVESGKRDERPELQKALHACTRHNARLLVSRLDRLSRDASFIFALQKSGARFTVANLPEASELTIQIFAAIAQHEGKMISERTKLALAQAKKRGVTLGGHVERISPAARKRGVAAAAVERTRQADEWAASFVDTLAEYRRDGLTLSAIADRFNRDEIPTRRGGQWTATQVYRLTQRLGTR